MLSGQHFYFKLFRKYVQTFGNMFNQITVLRENQSGTQEIQRIKVPIVYTPKDKMVSRLADPDLQRSVGIVLPRMGFEMKSMHYDASRKQITMLRHARSSNASRHTSQYMPVPYDFKFELNIYTKTIDDGNQIIEQILPYFTPDYTVTITPVQQVGAMKDIPIILDNVNQNIEYEGDENKERFVYWTLEFTLKGYVYGPVAEPKIIRKVITNIWNDPSLVRGHIIRMNLANGNNGIFMTGDTVYVGDNLNTTQAFGFVSNWNPALGRLEIGEAHGNFEIDQTIRSVSTNSAYQITSFDATPIKLAEIVIEPDPIDAEPTDDFGYTTTITEWPKTEYGDWDGYNDQQPDPPPEEEGGGGIESGQSTFTITAGNSDGNYGYADDEIDFMSLGSAVPNPPLVESLYQVRRVVDQNDNEFRLVIQYNSGLEVNLADDYLQSIRIVGLDDAVDITLNATDAGYFAHAYNGVYTTWIWQQDIGLTPNNQYTIYINYEYDT